MTSWEEFEREESERYERKFGPAPSGCSVGVDPHGQPALLPLDNPYDAARFPLSDDPVVRDWQIGIMAEQERNRTE